MVQGREGYGMVQKKPITEWTVQAGYKMESHKRDGTRSFIGFTPTDNWRLWHVVKFRGKWEMRLWNDEDGKHGWYDRDGCHKGL